MDEAPKPDNSLKASILITLFFMVALAALGLWLHPDEDPLAGPPATAKTDTQPASQGTDATGGGSPAEASQTIQPTRTTAEGLTDCRLLPSPDNDADSVWVSTAKGDFRFKVYYADAPDVGHAAAGRTEELMVFFGGLNEQEIRQLAREGQAHTFGTLSGKPLEVVTRWELDPEESTPQTPTYLAFIFWPNEQKSPVNLSSWLVRNGHAKIDLNCKEPVPGADNHTVYLATLERYLATSQQKQVGGWNVEALRVRPASHTTAR